MSTPLAPTRSAHPSLTVAWTLNRRTANLTTALDRVEIVSGDVPLARPDRTAIALASRPTRPRVALLIGHTGAYKGARMREFLKAVTSNNVPAADAVLALARCETPCSVSRAENRQRVARERGWTWPQERSMAAVDALDYLTARFEAETRDPEREVPSLDEFIATVRTKRVTERAPEGVRLVVECIAPHGVSKRAAADVLGVTPRTLDNWIAQFRESRFS